MNSYFFKMNKAEKNDILDQHRKVYDGFATQYGQSNQQPLYVQDFANDKGGVTVSNKGDVMSYRNMNINEMYYSGDAEFTPEQSFDFGGPGNDYMVSMGEQKDMIGDGPQDFDYGTFEDDDDEILVGPEGEVDMFLDDEPNFTDIEFEDEEVDDDIIDSLQEQFNKSLDMFRRFKNY